MSDGKSLIPRYHSHSLDDSINQHVKGGKLLSDEDLKAAFDFFDVKGSGKICGIDLRERMQALTKKMTKKEIKTFLDDEESITLQEIKEIVMDDELSIDHYAGAFSVLDPTGKGHISEERLKKIFLNLGFGDLNEEELRLLISTGDADMDGKIGFSDFVQLGSDHHTQSKQTK